MDENKIYEKLKNDTMSQDIPNGIKPENIMSKLGEQINYERDASVDVIEANRDLQKAKKGSKIKKFIGITGGLAAAIVTVIVGINVRNIIVEHKATSGLADKTVNSAFKTLASYAELEEYIENKNNRVEINFGDLFGGGLKGSASNSDGNIKEDAMVDMLPETSINGEGKLPETDASDNETDYSDTTVRTEGVLEADCIKTDGKYIFALSSKSYYWRYEESFVELQITKADGENTINIGKLDIKKMIEEKYPEYEGYYVINDMLLSGEKLIILGDYCTEDYQNDKTVIAVFDRTDEGKITLNKCFFVSGYYNQCRMNNGYLYVISNYRFTKDTLKPMIDDKYMECKDIYLSESDEYSEYMIFTSYDMNDEPVMVDNKAIVHDGYPEMYATKSNIYLLSSVYKSSFFKGGKEVLCIMKFSYEDGIIEALATAEIDGWLEDVFCVDEYNEYLRIVVTSYKNNDEINTLYVFDKEMVKVGSIENIAPGERIYSARFDGDVGYFVTFRQVDPLFSVDLSNPSEPKIIGELKIPGFSEYMYMWDEGKMLGIGEENGEVKLSMFDISDPHNVTEEDKTILEDVYSSEALYNHKAILVNGNKNIIGFAADGYFSLITDDTYDLNFSQFYCIYAYEDGKFVEKATVNLGSDFNGNVRGMYIGEYIYVVTTWGTVDVISMNDYSIVKSIAQ